MRRAWQAGMLAVGGAAVVGAMLWGAGNAHPAEEIRLTSGAAWLASAQVGQVTLLDGSSAEVAAQVKIASPGDALDVVQYGSTAYAVNRSTGTIRRVDGSSFEASQPAAPILDARDGLTAFAGKDVVHALDTERGVLASTDGKTLATRGQPLSLAAKLAAGGATVDGAGTLWVIDNATGDLSWVNDGQRQTRRGASEPGRGLLALAAEQPILVDSGKRTVTPVDPESGEAGPSVDIDLRPDDAVRVSGSPHNARLYAVGSRGVLIVCDLAASKCDRVVPLGADGDLGVPVEVGEHVLVPDFRTGKVWIVDLAGDQVRSSQPLMSPPAHFQLLARDGVVFYNDPDSERAGVLRLDGSTRPAAKYDPADPSKGLHTTAAQSSATAPTIAPSQTGPTTATVAATTQPTKVTQTTPPTNRTNPPTNNRPPQTGANPPITTTGPTLPPTTTAPTTTTTPTTTAPPAITLRVTLSKSAAEVGENVTAQVTTTSGETPESAEWDFGDTTNGSGLVVSHQWAAARTYQVSVQATMADGRTATTSASVEVTGIPTVRLTISVQGTGTVAAAGRTCPPSCAIDVPRGTDVTATATAGADWLLSGWSGGCTGTANPCRLKVNAATSVTATFTAKPQPAPEPEDCISHDPTKLFITQGGGQWQLNEDLGGGSTHNMIVFYSQADADNGLALARGYRQHCFVGRGTDMITHYWKDGSLNPISPEDCLFHDRGNVTIVEANDGQPWYSVRDGNQWMYAARTEAQAVRIKLLAQQFSWGCYIGRSNGPRGAETEYFR